MSEAFTAFGCVITTSAAEASRIRRRACIARKTADLAADSGRHNLDDGKLLVLMVLASGRCQLNLRKEITIGITCIQLDKRGFNDCLTRGESDNRGPQRVAAGALMNPEFPAPSGRAS